VARTALVRQGLVGVALLGIAPLICVVAVALPVLLPLFAVPLIALDSTLWIARARAEEQLRDPLTGLPNRQWLLERTWSALDAEGLLRRADVAMYQAKRDRTGVEVYESKRDSNTPDRLGLLGDLRRALDAGEVELHYQPKVRFDGQVAGLEALVRWVHPERG